MQFKPLDDEFKILQQFGEGIWKPKFLSEIDLNIELADLVTKVLGCFSGYLILMMLINSQARCFMKIVLSIGLVNDVRLVWILSIVQEGKTVSKI